MKRLLKNLLLFGMAVAICVACGNEPEVTKRENDTNDTNTTLELSKTELNFSNQAAATTVLVTVSGFWVAETPADWVSLSTYAGNSSGELTISVTPNARNSSRESYVKISASSYEKIITISQHGTIAIENGAIKAVFSVSNHSNVYFSQGNLQYQASTNTWRFAEYQYDMIALDNSNISSSYSGWIDLFGWGTSGWNSGANAYQPYSTSMDYRDYYPGGMYYNYLIDGFANADWGIYNQISNGSNQIGMWRTLTNYEWQYVIYERKDADLLKGVATINGINGLVLLPDDWKFPDDIAFTSGIANDFGSTFYATINNYSWSEWSKMETNGAVFFPASGKRQGTNVDEIGIYGNYWSSSPCDDSGIDCLCFNSSGIAVGRGFRGNAMSVRLVQDVK
jgi:hypothetical protein